jgi:hypothetical protein
MYLQMVRIMRYSCEQEGVITVRVELSRMSFVLLGLEQMQLVNDSEFRKSHSHSLTDLIMIQLRKEFLHSRYVVNSFRCGKNFWRTPVLLSSGFHPSVESHSLRRIREK